MKGRKKINLVLADMDETLTEHQFSRAEAIITFNQECLSIISSALEESDRDIFARKALAHVNALATALVEANVISQDELANVLIFPIEPSSSTTKTLQDVFVAANRLSGHQTTIKHDPELMFNNDMIRFFASEQLGESASFEQQNSFIFDTFKPALNAWASVFHNAGITLLPGVEEMVEHLSKTSTNLIIMTNGQETRIRDTHRQVCEQIPEFASVCKQAIGLRSTSQMLNDRKFIGADGVDLGAQVYNIRFPAIAKSDPDFEVLHYPKDISKPAPWMVNKILREHPGATHDSTIYLGDKSPGDGVTALRTNFVHCQYPVDAEKKGAADATEENYAKPTGRRKRIAQAAKARLEQPRARADLVVASAAELFSKYDFEPTPEKTRRNPVAPGNFTGNGTDPKDIGKAGDPNRQSDWPRK